MSDALSTHDDSPHEGPIKTPKQLILAVIFSFVVPIFAIVLLVSYVTRDLAPPPGSDGLSPQAVAARLQPVGRVEIKDASNPAELKNGEQVFAAVCTACHTAGVAGAPKLGDVAAWAPLSEQAALAPGFLDVFDELCRTAEPLVRWLCDAAGVGFE